MAERLTLDLNRLRELFTYDPTTGVLTWKVTLSNRAPAGTKAGTLHQGYGCVKINGRRYLVHRIAWALHYGQWPDGDLDHRDRIRSSNPINNLLLATSSENARNRLAVNLSSGFRGVTRKRSGRFQAAISLNNRLKGLGTFETPEDAARAYDMAVLVHCGPRFPTNASLGLLK